MHARLLHVFSDTPLGREALLESAYFCKTLGVLLVIYIPEFPRFLLYFEDDLVQVDLGSFYLKSPEVALEHATAIAEEVGVEPEFFRPKDFTSTTLPNLPTNFHFMSYPRSVSRLSSRTGLGHIGRKARRLVKTAPFPVLIPSLAYKEWRSIAVFFGGSANALNAFRVGLRLHEASGMPVDVFTQIEKEFQDAYEQIIEIENLKEELDRCLRQWYKFEAGSFRENLRELPHDALAVVGAYGHGAVREALFGGKLQLIQSTTGTSLLMVGAKYKDVRERWRR